MLPVATRATADTRDPRALSRTPSRRTSLVAVALALHLAWVSTAFAQVAATQPEALRVFLDCAACDENYLRQQITYLNYVVDREDAQVHVLVTTQQTGGGTELTFAFIGREAFAGRDDEVRYVSSDTDTGDELRQGIAHTLQLGLLRYLAGTPLAAQVEVLHDTTTGLGATQPEDDPWNGDVPLAVEI